MSPLVARWCLVGSAVVLLLVGVVGDLPGVARAVLLIAAACCAVLDALSARARGTDAPAPVVVTLPLGAADGPGTDEPHAVTGTGGPPSDRQPCVTTVDTDGSGLVLGRRSDGGSERAVPDPSEPCHVVVLGTGAFARAVFDALATQLGAPLAATAIARATGAVGLGLGLGVGAADVRVVSDTGPHAGAPPEVGPTPTGTAVAARLDDRGRVWATVVLVPSVHLLPRKRDRVVEVTRHGCRLWRHGDGGDDVVVPLEPVLPLLTGDPVDVLVAA